VTVRAAAQIDEAAAWWRRHRLAAPRAVLEDVHRAFRQLALGPLGAPRANGSGIEMRRLYLSRIGYHLYFHVDEASRVVVILALWHSRRGAGPSL
jgi:plasmid stabilization system protein ParE